MGLARFDDRNVYHFLREQKLSSDASPIGIYGGRQNDE